MTLAPTSQSLPTMTNALTNALTDEMMPFMALIKTRAGLMFEGGDVGNHGDAGGLDRRFCKGRGEAIGRGPHQG